MASNGAVLVFEVEEDRSPYLYYVMSFRIESISTSPHHHKHPIYYLVMNRNKGTNSIKIREEEKNDHPTLSCNEGHTHTQLPSSPPFTSHRNRRPQKRTIPRLHQLHLPPLTHQPVQIPLTHVQVPRVTLDDGAVERHRGAPGFPLDRGFEGVLGRAVVVAEV